MPGLQRMTLLWCIVMGELTQVEFSATMKGRDLGVSSTARSEGQGIMGCDINPDKSNTGGDWEAVALPRRVGNGAIFRRRGVFVGFLGNTVGSTLAS